MQNKPEKGDFSSQEHLLWLWTEMLNSWQLPPFSDQTLVSRLQSSPAHFERLVGNLLGLGQKFSEASSVASVLEKACCSGPQAFGKYARDILIFLLRFRRDVLELAGIKIFILEAARSSDISCRINVSHILKQLKSAEARHALEILKNDSDERVRRNAAVAIEELSRD